MKGLKRILFTKLMPLIGPYVGADQPVPVAAKRYVDALTDQSYKSGVFYASRDEKMTGRTVDQTSIYDVFANKDYQDSAYNAVARFA